MEALHADITIGLRSFPLSARLDVGRERIALVGPSGAGKTTALRAIAGLVRPDRGRIALGDEVWFDADSGVDRAPEQRSVGLVFQEYALFPHLSVRSNVAFGGRPRVGELLERFRIAHLADQRPDAISGGERQRVALARALAREPAVLLLDEPLSALDAQTRGVVRGELQDLLADLELPTLLVTHDFADAAALADRVGVLVDGHLRQLSTPQGLIDAPADAVVARFTGANVLYGTARAAPAGGALVALDEGGELHTAQRASGRVALAIHPWRIAVATETPPGPRLNALPGPVSRVTVSAGQAHVRVGVLDARVAADATTPQRGDRAWAIVEPEAVIVLPDDGPVTGARRPPDDAHRRAPLSAR